MDVREYTLPDAYLFRLQDPGWQVQTWVPVETCIILGASNKAGSSLIIKNVEADDIPVFQRPSGGETVVLTSDMLIISAVQPQAAKLSGGSRYFHYYNTLIMDALTSCGIPDVAFRGISDLAIGEKKILGSAIYQNRNAVFYHAVLNIAGDPRLFSRYLQHPGREPDYRVGRDHPSFVTSIEYVTPSLDAAGIQAAIDEQFARHHCPF